MEHPKGEEAGQKLAGLGTPATRADIIKILFAREYIREEKKKLLSTERGFFLVGQLLKNDDLQKMTRVDQTTEWEQKLLDNPDAFEKEIAEYIKKCVTSSGGADAVFQQENLGACPLCGKPVVESKISYGCSG